MPVASGTSAPVGVGMRLSAGPFLNYHFFSDAAGDNIVVVIEQTSGLFKHLGWGKSLNKAGTYTGGAYFFGVASGYYASYVSTLNNPGFDITAKDYAHENARRAIRSHFERTRGLDRARRRLFREHSEHTHAVGPRPCRGPSRCPAIPS